MQPESSHTAVRAGQLLIALPAVEDPNFKRTVILLCDHGDEGSFGLVLNRPTTVTPGEVFETLEPVPHAISFGGPVQPDTMHFLHRIGDRVPDAVPIFEDCFWGGDFDRVQAVLESNPGVAARMRFFLGYAGWGAGQLDDEVAEGSWLVVMPRLETVFPAEPSSLWRSLLRSLGGEYGIMANWPDDPRMN